MPNRNITFKKKKGLPKWVPAAVCIAVAVIIAVICVSALAVKRKKEIEKNRVSGGIFLTEGFENISDIKCVDEKFNIFTDTESGKSGIMTLDGVITEKAQNDNFSVFSDKWRNKRYTVKSPRSEYILLIDTETLSISTRQYHGIHKPEKIPCWDEKKNRLSWADDSGMLEAVKPKELELSQGLYPVATSLSDGARYGYINENAELEIAAVYDKVQDFNVGIAAVKLDGKWGYITENGLTLIECGYESESECNFTGEDISFAFKNGLAPVKKDGKYGIINTKGETVAGFVFDMMLQGKNGKYMAKKDGAWGILTVDEAIIASAGVGQTEPTTLPPAPAVSGGMYIVSTSGSVLNMRTEAKPGASVIGKLPKGTVVEVTDSVPGWAYVTYKNSKGWVSADFLAPYTEPSTAETSQTAVTENL